MLLELHVRLADEPEALVAGPLLLQVVGQQVGVHLRLEQRHARPVRLVDVLGGFRVELEGGEDDRSSAWAQGLRFFKAMRHLPLFQRGVLRAEGNHDALRLGRAFSRTWSAAFVTEASGFRRRRAASDSRERLQAGEADVLPALPRMPARSSSSRHSPAAGSRRSGQRRRRRLLRRLLRSNLIQRLHCRRGHGFHRERAR